MRKLRWLVYPVLLVVLVALPWALFHLAPSTPRTVVVLDKTVPFDSFIEHAGFFWLLDQLRIVHPSGERYDVARDYIGATPGARPGDPPARTQDLRAEHVAGADLLYLIDTYGVYHEDLTSGVGRRAALEHSNKIYGGLSQEEATVFRDARAAGTTVVAEFNSMASPTSDAARALVEQTVGVRWTHWIGRFFPALDDEQEVPLWMRDLCSRVAQREWNYRGAGYLLIQDDTRCELLLDGRDFSKIGLTVEPESDARQEVLRNAAPGTPYTFWFELVIPAEGTEVLASYQWDLSGDGNDRLRALGLPQRFPAVTRLRVDDGGPAYYFAGDFADSTVRGKRVPLAGFVTLRRFIEKTRRVPSHHAFFYRFYAPLMIEILAESGRDPALDALF